MVFKGIIDSITRARAYYLYLCEHLPACVKFLLRVSIELAHEKTYKRRTSEETRKRGRHNKVGAATKDDSYDALQF